MILGTEVPKEKSGNSKEEYMAPKCKAKKVYKSKEAQEFQINKINIPTVNKKSLSRS